MSPGKSLGDIWGAEYQSTNTSILTFREFKTNQIPWDLREHDRAVLAPGYGSQWICLTTRQGWRYRGWGLILGGDTLTMWHLHRDALMWPQYVFLEWDDILSQIALFPIAQTLPELLRTWIGEKEVHLREKLRLYRSNVKIINLSKVKPDIQCLASFIIIPFHRPQMTLVLKNSSHLSKTLFLKYPYDTFQWTQNLITNHATKKCGEWVSVHPVSPDPCCLQLLSTCESIQECRVTASSTASCLSKVTFSYTADSFQRKKQRG